jgi:hypothetical protein
MTRQKIHLHILIVMKMTIKRTVMKMDQGTMMERETAVIKRNPLHLHHKLTQPN